MDGEALENVRPNPFALVTYGEQDMLRLNDVVAKRPCFADRELENLLRARRERNRSRPRRIDGADDVLHHLARFLEREVKLTEHPGGRSLFLPHQSQQEMLGTEVRVAELSCLFLSEIYCLPPFVCEPLEHSSGG